MIYPRQAQQNHNLLGEYTVKSLQVHQGRIKQLQSLFLLSIYRKNSGMEPQSVTIPTRSIKSLRSNSIRNQDGNGYAGLNVKVNLKKFPIDFFNTDNLPSARLAKRPTYSNQGHKTERKLFTNFTQELYKQNQILPEAKITSSFNICLDSTETNDSNPSRNDGFPADIKLTVSDLDKVIGKEEATSIDLNDRNEHNLNMCCTFSKIPISKSNFVTPSRQRSNEFGKDKIDDKCEGTFSARVSRRASTKLRFRDLDTQKQRRQSIQNRGGIKWEGANKNMLGTKLVKRQFDQLCLPQISRNNNN